ncbi:MAG: chemotaxis protein CheA [Planctomycetota bacterium]
MFQLHAKVSGASPYIMSNDEILREFLLETHENLTLLDSDLVHLEKHPSDHGRLAQVFRTLHSVKGTAGFMGLVKLQAVAHSAESLLSRLRSGDISYSVPIATALLRVVDAIREIAKQIETTGSEGEGNYANIASECDRLREHAIPPAIEAVTKSIVGPAPQVTVPTAIIPAPTVTPSLTPSQQDTVSASDSPASAPTELSSTTTRIVDSSDARSGSVTDSSIRVDVGLLDKLMTLVGELVLARNQILQCCSHLRNDAVEGAVQRLNVLTTELQASVMKTRMQPIGTVLGKFPRVVRDLAVACGKQVRFEIDGQETELDKTLLEAIRDPLTHLVRNAIDHGIESPTIRVSAGKSPEGRLRMMAFHEGGKVIIEITDDGSGIHVDRVKEKAIANQLITPEMAATMSRDELLRLIFLPGFSTTDKVTQFSGRGVGMDVVRTNIERIGGTVDLESHPGAGTTVRTKIPLTLAIIPALIIVTGGERYAIPQVSLLELVHLDADHTAGSLEWMYGAPVYRLRGDLLPLVFLDEQLGLAEKTDRASGLNIVVLQADDRAFGLVVDSIRDTEEIVVKPLQQQLKGLPTFAGAAIMGDGRVALVLDVLGLAQRSGVNSGSMNQLSNSIHRDSLAIEDEAPPSLVFLSSRGEPMAIPLSQIARLEEFPGTKLESLGDYQVVQYRGGILPLVDISDELIRLSGKTRLSDVTPSVSPAGRSHTVSSVSRDGSPDDQMVAVIVCHDGTQHTGIIVGQILDIVHQRPESELQQNRPGVLSTAIVEGRVTEFVNVPSVVQAARQRITGSETLHVG